MGAQAPDSKDIRSRRCGASRRISLCPFVVFEENNVRLISLSPNYRNPRSWKRGFAKGEPNRVSVARVPPNLARMGPKLAKIWPALVEGGVQRPDITQKVPPQAFVEHLFKFCLAPSPAGRNLAKHLSGIFSRRPPHGTAACVQRVLHMRQRVEIEGGGDTSLRGPLRRRAHPHTWVCLAPGDLAVGRTARPLGRAGGEVARGGPLWRPRPSQPPPRPPPLGPSILIRSGEGWQSHARVSLWLLAPTVAHPGGRGKHELREKVCVARHPPGAPYSLEPGRSCPTDEPKEHSGVRTARGAHCARHAKYVHCAMRAARGAGGGEQCTRSHPKPNSCFGLAGRQI